MTARIPYKWLVATAFVMGLFMEILDMTVLNTALPILGEHFGADTAQLQWLVTGYLVSLAVFIPASGWVADRFGDKQTFLFALAVYTAANLWAGTAGSVTELLLARVTQGVGGGLLTPWARPCCSAPSRPPNVREPRPRLPSRPHWHRCSARCWAAGWPMRCRGAGSSS